MVSVSQPLSNPLNNSLSKSLSNSLSNSLGNSLSNSVSQSLTHAGARWLSGKFGALRPESRRFESHSSRHLRTLGKSFTRKCLESFGVLTSTQHPCYSRELF